MLPDDARAFPLDSHPIRVDDDDLDDLRRRLRATRWPAPIANADWHYGVEAGYLRELVDYWIDGFDWRAAEARLNAYAHYWVDVDGVPVHFLYRAGVGPAPTPLILTHGWPWTFWHWSKVIDPLADPGGHDGDPADAFDVIVPSFPGYGFSVPFPPDRALTFSTVADLWHELMTGVLGFERYAAAGSDQGALVTQQLGHKYADELYAIHLGSTPRLDLFTGPRAWDFTRGADPALAAPEVRAGMESFQRRFAAHVAVHVLDSATLAYGLSDSPVGMLAWVLDRWNNWSDDHGDVESVFSKDDLLTHATIWWVTNSLGSSLRSYSEANRHPWVPSHDRMPPVEAPTGVTFVGYENPPGVSTEERISWFDASDKGPWTNRVAVTAHDHGGHFVPWEVPTEFVDDLRRTFRGRVPGRRAHE